MSAAATERLICPVHQMPDCSPLLNGCSRITAAHERVLDPSHRTVVFGASDDLIEVRGTEIEEELNPPLDGKFWVVLSTGHVLEVRLEEEWRFRLEAGDARTCVLVNAVGEDSDAPRDDDDGCPQYSDKAVIYGVVEWVALTDRVQRRNR